MKIWRRLGHKSGLAGNDEQHPTTSSVPSPSSLPMLGDKKSTPDLPPIPTLDVVVPDVNDKLISLLPNNRSPLPRIPSDASLPTPEANVSPMTSGNVTPITPISPGGFPNKPPKKTNPLVDLMETEKIYVDLLGGIIRKVAAAWSRSNLPPKQLDSVFRAIEVVYKANRALLNRLNEIGPKPSSPKALGDLLMRWIEDLDAPYTRYTQTYVSAFDEWQVILNNLKLPQILAEFSNNYPPLLIDSSVNDTKWSLDSLLALPRTRLKYYKKLYGRLFKSTSPGRSDFELLRGANEKLDDLISQLETRSHLKAGEANTFGVDNTDQSVEDVRLSVQSGSQSSSRASGARSSRETAHTSFGPLPLAPPEAADIERQITTQGTVDIFTMRPRQVKLALNPPGLPFIRQLRISCDATIQITPRSDGRMRLHQYGHLFLMTDLFLVCERLKDEDRERFRQGNPEAFLQPEWSLCYPPLAARHLLVTPGDEVTLNVQVMKKEDVILRLPNAELRNKLLQGFLDAIEMAASLQNVPKTSQLNGLPTSPSSTRELGLPNSQLNGPHQVVDSTPTTGDSSAALLPGQIPPRQMSLLPHKEHLVGQVYQSKPSTAENSLLLPPIVHPQPLHVPSQLPVLLANGAASSISQNLSALALSERVGPSMQLHSAPFSGTADFSPPPRGTSMMTADDRMIRQAALNERPINSAPAIEQSNHGNSIASSYYGVGSSIPRPSSRASTDPSPHSTLKKAPSSRSLRSQHTIDHNALDVPPPMPSREGSFTSNFSGVFHHTGPIPPSIALRNSQAFNGRIAPRQEVSPPTSPVAELQGADLAITSSISAQMRCKVFLKQQHAQWKSLGAARLKLYHQFPTNVKQLVVEADTKDHPILISTIILTDGVERVGKTGVAIELSDKGTRTGIVYMIQLRNEASASGLFDQLLRGSDRTARQGG